CRIRSAEAEGRWREAGEHWEKREAWEDAARCWNRAGEAARGNECLAWSRQAEGNWAEAARLWKGAGNPERAAAAWRQAGREQEALREEAGLQESKQRWEEAAVIWERLGEERRAIRCRATRAESDGDWAVAAREWERMEEFTAAANAWRKADAPAEVRRCAIKIDLAAGRYARAAEAAEEIADFREAAAAWRQALAAGQRPRRPLPLPLPEDARNPWAPGCPRARLAGRDSRPGTRMDPLSRALVCEVRAAEDAGDYGTAERLWTDLRDRGQALRCRVASLRNQGRGADAAALLEERGKLEAARSAWMEAGQPDRAARCEAVYLEKTKRFQKAADVWERLGEAASAARCRGRHFLRRGDFDAAEGFLAEAGVEGKALQRVVRAIQCIRRKDFDQAERLLTEAGEEGKLALRMLRTARAAAARRLPARGPSGRKRPSLRRAYELAEWGRTLPASATVGAGWSPVGHRPKRRQGSRTPGAGHGSLPLFPETGTSPSRREARRRTSPAAWGSPETEGALPLQERILARVARVPGLTCMELAEMTDLPVAGIKPVLRDLVRKGRLRKTGLTRGTRYWLPGSVPKTGDPDGV
ncbi:MAG: hypothetical protein HY509_03940, partial [Acidobacteria bacterium]|nr:hypothetical protein [Acidobacteriota bacterium]